MTDVNGQPNERLLWTALGGIQSDLRTLLDDRRAADDRMEKLNERLSLLSERQNERVNVLERDSVSWKSVFGIASLMTALGEAISHWWWKN